MKFIEKLDRDKNLPEEYKKEDINLLRANTVFNILNDPPRSWDIMSYFANSSPEEIENAVKKKEHERRKH